MSDAVRSPRNELPEAGGAKTAGWWHVSEDGEWAVCDLCPRACSIKPGKRGFCFVRENRQGQLFSTTYERSTGFCVDPIEKKPLNQFYPGTAVLSFGTAGCNLGCKFCQNWSMSRSRDVDAACEVASAETIARAARELGCRSVAFTYNDPIIWAEYAVDTARACHALGVKTVAVTSGYISPGARAAFFEVIDAANVDLKAFTEEFYRELTGGQLQPVLDTLRYLARETDVWLEVTNLVIPGANDSADELQRMCDWMVAELGPDVPLHFSAFHPDFKLVDRGGTPLATLLAAHQVARRAGLRYVYTGNVSDRERQSTYCPACRRAVIVRDGYTLGGYDVREGRCRFCRQPIAGRFDDRPGDWSGHRLPVRIADYAVPETIIPPARETTNVERKSVPQPELSGQQDEVIFQVAARRVAATVTSDAAEPIAEVLGDAAERPVFGVFVSLKRSGQLRSCCGILGEAIPLSEALDRAAQRAATDDPRFPPISSGELEHLDMEVWLLWAPQPVEAKGEDRARAFTIGRHGLQIARGDKRGLLLPGVAVDLELDQEGFLRQVCQKAGLPTDAWKQDDTLLLTFEGRAIKGPLASVVGRQATPPDLPSRETIAAMAEFYRSNISAMVQGATPSYYMPGLFDGGVNGLMFTIGKPGGQGVACSKISLRPEMPLQATLFRFAEATAQGLRARGVNLAAFQQAEVSLTILLDPAMHGTVAEAKLEGIDPRHRAVMVMEPDRTAWVFDPDKTPQELLADAAEQAKLTDPSKARVVSLAVVSTDPRAAVAQVPREEPKPVAEEPEPVAEETEPVAEEPVEAKPQAEPEPEPLAEEPEPGPVVEEPVEVEPLAEAEPLAEEPEPVAEEPVEAKPQAEVEPEPVAEEPVLEPVAEEPVEAKPRVEAAAPAAPVPTAAPKQGTVRPAAVAGAFYPADAAEVDHKLDEMFAAAGDVQPESWPAVMAPHAGWIYSGSLAAKVFSRVTIPEQVIVLCPKHRPGGARWAVAPHDWWELPGREVASDRELAKKLAQGIAGLQLDSLAHRQEHAVEVQLPLLHRRSSQAGVVGITIGGGSLPELRRFGQQMADVLRKLPHRPLLVISGDMNHFSDEKHTRYVDRMALYAMESLDPVKLFKTVRDNNISMCGVMAAVIVMATLRELDSLKRTELVGYATSAEVSGDLNRVVGYAGVLLG